MQGMAQKLPKGNFKMKSDSLNPVFLEKMGKDWEMDEVFIFMKKPCEYIDTTVYWTFYKQDSLKIETVIRKCILNSDTNRTNKIKGKNEHTIIKTTAPEIRTGLWEQETGSYKLEDKYLKIKGTTKYDGEYLYAIPKNKKGIKLVLKQ